MYTLISEIPGHHTIKNLIFDFGGVICGLDIARTEKKFKEFGPAKLTDPASQKESANVFEKLVEHLETGAITPDQFRQAIRDHYLNPPTDEAIDETWNAMLLPISDERIHLLQVLRNRYRIFLLSNSNKIHMAKYLPDFQRQTGYHDFNDLFEKAYFSCEVGLKKPEPEIYRFVLSDSRLKPEESLFIDDMPENVKGAESVGIKGFHLINGTQITDLFRKEAC
jgi:glucose-1-phosphatase